MKPVLFALLLFAVSVAGCGGPPDALPRTYQDEVADLQTKTDQNNQPAAAQELRASIARAWETYDLTAPSDNFGNALKAVQVSKAEAELLDRHFKEYSDLRARAQSGGILNTYLYQERVQSLCELMAYRETYVDMLTPTEVDHLRLRQDLKESQSLCEVYKLAADADKSRIARLEAEVARLNGRLKAEKSALAALKNRHASLLASTKRNTLLLDNRALQAEVKQLRMLVMALSSPEPSADSYQSDRAADVYPLWQRLVDDYEAKMARRPPMAENGDVAGADNDGDGRGEPVHVQGYYRRDGTYVRGHYRARPGY